MCTRIAWRSLAGSLLTSARLVLVFLALVVWVFSGFSSRPPAPKNSAGKFHKCLAISDPKRQDKSRLGGYHVKNPGHICDTLLHMSCHRTKGIPGTKNRKILKCLWWLGSRTSTANPQPLQNPQTHSPKLAYQF